jgi:NAD(P)-dependent dehydrogenase (short-subunit alcohol dehydrogenase family)
MNRGGYPTTSLLGTRVYLSGKRNKQVWSSAGEGRVEALRVLDRKNPPPSVVSGSTLCEVAAAVVFLARDDASGINGATLSVMAVAGGGCQREARAR